MIFCKHEFGFLGYDKHSGCLVYGCKKCGKVKWIDILKLKNDFRIAKYEVKKNVGYESKMIIVPPAIEELPPDRCYEGAYVARVAEWYQKKHGVDIFEYGDKRL